MSTISIRELDPKDRNKAISFAISGMHFDQYITNPLLLRLYGRYFWYLENSRATHLKAAYQGDELLGVILAEVKGQPPLRQCWYEKAFSRTIDWLQKTFFKSSAGTYDTVNKDMLDVYKEHYQPDGEIIFLAANPTLKVKGVGTALLNALEKDLSGKEIYLYTDSLCTYQFYEKRGFERYQERTIELTLNKKKVPLSCFLYRKKIA